MPDKHKDWQQALEPKESEGITVSRYRAVYSTPIGCKILADRLVDLGVFSHLATDEHRVRHNAGIDLLVNTGILKPDGQGRLNVMDIQKIVMKLFSIERDK